MKFAVTSISIRVLAQILFTHTYINRNIAEYSITIKVCFQYSITNTQMFLYLFKDLLLDNFINLHVKRLSSFLL